VGGNMNSKERVLKAFKREEPDRIPVFSSLTDPVAEKLSKKLDVSPHSIDAFLSSEISHSELLLELGNDAICIGPEYPDSTPPQEIAPDLVKDEWGIVYKKVDMYEEMVERPLGNIDSTEELNEFEFPSADAPGRFSSAQYYADEYGQNYALIGNIQVTMFEMAWYLLGLEKFLKDLAAKKDYIFTLLDTIKEYKWNCAKKLIDIGVDILWTGDDFGTQNGMLISPDLWREVFKSRYRDLFKKIKTKNSDVIIAYHSCGSIRPIIRDLVEIGLEVLHPIQPKATDMNLLELKKEFGSELAFFGGIDIQELLPYANPSEISAEVKKCIWASGKGGGYMVAPAHNIQPDTPLKNIYSMYESVKKYGSYPIR